MSELIRTFIGVELDQEVRQALNQIQEQLCDQALDIKWVETGNLHLTLKFLGETSPKKVKAIRENFPTFFKKLSSFEILLSILGAFPNVLKPRIIWAGVSQHTQKIVEVFNRLEKGLNILGLPKDQREFHPHVTLGRVRSFKNLNKLTAELKRYQMPRAITTRITTVAFFQSQLTATGPIYKVLAKTIFP